MRTYFLTFIFLFVLLGFFLGVSRGEGEVGRGGGKVGRGEGEVVRGNGEKFAFTDAEKIIVLEKCEAFLKWIRTMSPEILDGTPTHTLRSKISPIELIQGAAILQEQNKKNVSVKLREQLSLLYPTMEECFDIEDRIGAAVLESFRQDTEQPQAKVGGDGGWSGAGLNSADFIQKGAAKFLNEGLNAAEKIAIMNQPTTAIDLMNAIDLLTSTGRPSFTRYYLRKFLKADKTPADCAAIVDKFGTARLMQISLAKSFAPIGADAVNQIFIEAKKHWRNRDIIAKAADNLTIKLDPRYLGTEHLSLDKFHPPLILPDSLKNLQTLWQGEEISALQLLDKLGETEDEERVEAIVAALLSIGGDIKELLAVSLRTKNKVLLKNAIHGLKQTITRDELFLLYQIAFAKSADIPNELKTDTYNFITSQLGKNAIKSKKEFHAIAVRTLYQRARDYYSRNRNLRAEPDGSIRFWNWDETTGKPAYIQLRIPDAYRLFANRYAALAYEIAEAGGRDLRTGGIDFEAVRRFYLVTLFEQILFANGLDSPLDLDGSGLLGAVSSVPLEQIEQVILDAIDDEHYEAARVAVLLFARKGNTASLTNYSGRHRQHPLITAVGSGDSRLRFAALEVVMGFSPAVHYQGSSRVVDALVWFSRGEGQRRVVVAHPKRAEASRLSGYFISLGYGVELALTGREAFMLAADSPDVELVVIDEICRSPAVFEFAQMMRRDCRTHNIPIAILGGVPQKTPRIVPNEPNITTLDFMQRVDRLRAAEPLRNSISQTYPRPTDDYGAEWIEADLLHKTSTTPVPQEIRLEQASKSLKWIKKILADAEAGRKIYQVENAQELVMRGIQSNQHLNDAISIAAEIKSSNIQAAIYDVVADGTLPFEARQNAADAFGESVKKHGILLRGKQVLHIYNRYNASESEPKESQELLNRIIDIIEEKVNKKNHPK
ncbi:MAG: hypothetical protein LBQ66_03270, partial [Planctomycetaceae bacterium]|nr:hypothetical protein [Planctomycetaceae bacterium]